MRKEKREKNKTHNDENRLKVFCGLKQTKTKNAVFLKTARGGNSQSAAWDGNKQICKKKKPG